MFQKLTAGYSKQIINDGARQPGTEHRAPTIEQFGKPTSNSIPTIIRGFKSSVTNTHNQRENTPGFKLWQRNYWEHVIRNDVSMSQLREYIVFNSFKWKEDRFYCRDNDFETIGTHTPENKFK